MVTGASAGPARLPSKTFTWTWREFRAITLAMASARVTVVPLSSGRNLVVQVRQPPVRVVGVLDGPVRVPVVPLPELLFGIVHGRVQRLVAAQVVHRLLDQPVVVVVGLARLQRC